MDELQGVFLRGLLQHVAALEMAVSELQAGDPSAEDAMVRIAHQLKGSGASFGFPAITARAAGVMAAPPAGRLGEVESLLQLLRRTVSEGAVPSRLLVVDDDVAIRALIATALADREWEVSQAASVGEARQALVENSYDGVLLDLVLPDGDGRNLLAEVRSKPATARTAVIMLSANDNSAVKAECFALGADGYLEKPLDVGLLPGLVSTIIRRTGGTTEEDGGSHLSSRDLPGPSDPESPSGSSVLLAEDDRMTASLIIDRFERAGYRVVHCQDGESALTAALDGEFQVAILDVKMPMMDGFELLQRLRQVPELDTMPVIMLTAMGNEDDVVRAFDLGADDYVLKPFSPGEILARVGRLARRAA
ncbi:MAG: response regulator [Acidimicrobiia bacterium]